MKMQHEELHKQFLVYLENQGKANATILAYGKDIEQLIEFLKERGIVVVHDVDTNHIEEFKDRLKKLRYTAKSISRKINSIKTFFRYLIHNQIVSTNPAEVVAHPKYDQNMPRILSRTEYRALRDACKDDVRMAAIVEVLLQTGMRISEVANLRLDDVLLDQNALVVREQNSHAQREVPLNKAAVKAVQAYLEIRPKGLSETTVFLTKTTRPFLVRNIRASIDRYFRIAGIKEAKVNDLRHTFIVEQLKAGTPLTYVSKLVGHKRVTTTERYLEYIEQSDLQKNVKLEEL